MPDEQRRHSVSITIRLTPERYEDLLAKCAACEPPSTPTAAIRWLIQMWIEEGERPPP